MTSLFSAITLLLPITPVDTLPLPKDYAGLESRIEFLKGKPDVWRPIAAYRDKATGEHDWERLADAYYFALYESNGTDRLIYADSIIMAASHTNDEPLIGDAYLAKGMVYYYRKDHLRALDNYIIANAHIANSDDPYLKNKVKYHMALVKSYLGYYHEAISLLRECTAYYENEDPFAYANSLHSLALCYSRTGDLQSSKDANALAIKVSEKACYNKIKAYTEHLEGINLYYSTDYSKSIEVLGHAVKQIQKDKDFATEAISYFFIGKSYLSLKMEAKAIPYFKKVDSIYLKKKYIRPELRENYELLIDYYHRQSNLAEALPYIERLLLIDKEIESNFKYLNQKIHKEYDTRDLEAFKKDAEYQLALDYLLQWGAVMLIVTITCVGGYFLLRSITAKKRYRRKYETLLNKINTTGLKEHTASAPIPVADAITERILKCLEDFERDAAFAEPEITATALAERFGTNNKYLSRVILAHREKGFTDYINGLRINYITQRLRDEPRLRQYHTSGLAQEAGFVSPQHFGRIFKKLTGMTPAYFIQETERERDI